LPYADISNTETFFPETLCYRKLSLTETFSYGDVLYGDVLYGDVLYGDVLCGDVIVCAPSSQLL
jgi:hypothetical protein